MARREKARLSHVGRDGSARMVDVSHKPETHREAVARGSIRISREAMKLVREGRSKKGNVVETARLAGILAAKRASDIIPLCHPLPPPPHHLPPPPAARGDPRGEASLGHHPSLPPARPRAHRCRALGVGEWIRYRGQGTIAGTDRSRVGSAERCRRRGTYRL